jgi:hypothetical protein
VRTGEDPDHRHVVPDLLELRRVAAEAGPAARTAREGDEVINVTVPKIDPAEVERVNQAMQAVGRTMREVAPVVVTMLAKVAQQFALLAPVMRTAYERNLEELRRERG